MKKNKLIVKTKRLNLYPLSDLEIQKLISDSKDNDLAMAYTQMLNSCQNNPSERNWYAPWAMETKDGKQIGTLGFKEAEHPNSVEIGYGINKEYEGLGYTTEAAKALIDWAFDNEYNNDNILFVEAEADENNLASIHILEKLGFTKYGQGKEGPRFVKINHEMSYTAIGISIGLCLGLSIGLAVFDNMTIGMCIGLALGTCFGAAKDKHNEDKINNIKKELFGI